MAPASIGWRETFSPNGSLSSPQQSSAAYSAFYSKNKFRQYPLRQGRSSFDTRVLASLEMEVYKPEQYVSVNNWSPAIVKLFLLTGFLISITASVQAQDCSKAPALMKHVYNPQRLVEKKGCITVTGIIVKKLKEKDGDFHVRLKLDPGQGGGLINSRNTLAQGGAMVFEPICVLPVTQKSAKKACRNWKQKINLPNKGDHIEVTGLHMLDMEHGWLEIHPVTKISLLK